MDEIKRFRKFSGMVDEEVSQVLVQFNDTQVEYPTNVCLHQLFEAQVTLTPDAVALIFEESRLTYSELNEKANQLAHHLQTLGVGPEVSVGVYMERSLEMVIALYGILKAGGAYVPLDPAYPADRVAYMLEDSRPPVLLTQMHLKARLPENEAEVVCLDTEWERIEGEDIINPVSGVKPENLAYIIFTSGTTGRPKGVMNCHQGICNRLLWMQDQYHLTESDRVIQKTPYSFDVSVWEFFWPLLFGAQLIVAKPGGHKDSNYLVSLIVDKGITTIHFVPSMLQIFLDDRKVEDCQILKRVICSGEALPYDLQERFFSHLTAELHNLYGPTEAAVDVTYWACEQGSSLGFVPIGRPVANTQIYLLNEYMEPIPLGEAGELHIGGIQVARGYINSPELTEEKFIDDPFSDVPGAHLYKTGDLASYLPTGDIKFLGRIDHQVKIGGNRIELGEIETVLGLHLAIKQAVVLAREDEHGEKRLVAYLVTVSNQNIDTQLMRQYLEEKLPDYMIPSAFIPIESMPLSPNGKVDRHKLPKPDNVRPELGQAYVAPHNELESYLASLWCEIINLDQVGVNDRFFELGGTSLQAARFINKLQKDFSENIYVVSIFESPTIGEYAAFLRHDYPHALQKKFGKEKIQMVLPSPDQEISSTADKITEGDLTHMRKIIIPISFNNKVEKEEKNSPAIFILAPPRSGTTLLRVMLAGHPDLFAGSELQLLGFNSLRERREAYSGKYKLWLEGTIRIIMEIHKCNAEDATRIMEQYEEKDYSTKDFYAILQDWIGNKILIDKSPSYALDINTLEKAERDFDQAQYIHLVRHPYAVVRSFENYHMDQVLYLREQPFSPQQLGELVWLVSHKNVIEFLREVPKQRQIHLRFEDLVSKPQEVMEKMCQALQITFHASLVNPYDRLGEKMTDGIYQESKPMGDTNFIEHGRINPEIADDWKGVLSDNFLSDMTWDLAVSLGYEDPATETILSTGSIVKEVDLVARNRHERLEEIRRRRMQKRK